VSDDGPTAAEGLEPTPVAPPGRLRRARRPHRTWGQRLLIGFNSVLVIVCLGAAAGLAYVERQVSDVPRLNIGGVLDDKPASGEAQNFLLVGVDNGAGLEQDDPVLYGREDTLNTDTIMVLRVEPGSERASLLSFPRDLWVSIAGTSSNGKINSALSLGGPERLIQTIQQNFGIPINHYVQVDFAGFKSLVSAIDGVPVYFPWPARDENTGLYVEEPGCITLDPDQALAFARSRFFQTYQDGRWRFDESSDFGRISRQQAFIRAAMKRAVAKGVRNPFTLNQLISVGQQSVTLDNSLTTEQIVDLGMQFREFDPDELDIYTVPGRDATTPGGAAVVYVDEKAAQPIFDIFRGVDGGAGADAVPTARVEVRNGSGVSGQGREALVALEAAGFVAVDSSDASDFAYPTTVILYAPGQELAAANVARFVDGEPVLEEDPSIGEQADVVVITGADFTAVRTEPRPLDDFQTFLATTTTASAPVAPEGEGGTTTTVIGDVPTAPEGVSCG
jgi:polyisoprenyl-teichoic acid--peptidoglycan teichoic acid transferase